MPAASSGEVSSSFFAVSDLSSLPSYSKINPFVLYSGHTKTRHRIEQWLIYDMAQNPVATEKISI